MPLVYIQEAMSRGSSICVEMEAIPRVGEDIYVGFLSLLDDPEQRAKYEKGFIEKAERWRDTIWQCTAVLHEARYLGGSSTVRLTVVGRPL